MPGAVKRPRPDMMCAHLTGAKKIPMNETTFTATTDTNTACAAQTTAAGERQEFVPLPQKPIPLAQWRKHDASNYKFASNAIQRHLVIALEALSAKHGSDWMRTEQWWSDYLADEIAAGLEKEGCLFPQCYDDVQHSSYPISADHLQTEDIAELGYDVSRLTHEDMARFACALRWYSGIEETAERVFHLIPLVSRERLAVYGFDASKISEQALLRFSAAVHRDMAGFDPQAFPADFEAVIRYASEREFGLLRLPN